MAVEKLTVTFERFKSRVASVDYQRKPWVDGDLWERAAREYANAHGHFGTTGGWIVRAESQADATAGRCSRGFTQGWDNYRRLFRTEILDWFTQQLTANPSFRALTSPAAGSTYRPTILVLKPADWRQAFLASAYDVEMARKQDARRAYTGHTVEVDPKVRAREWHEAYLRGALR
jgi:hypothetical protein